MEEENLGPKARVALHEEGKTLTVSIYTDPGDRKDYDNLVVEVNGRQIYESHV